MGKNTTKQRAQEIATTADQLLNAHGIDPQQEHTPTTLRAVIESLRDRTHCDPRTARKHVLQALDRQRGTPSSAPRGGLRAGAGRKAKGRHKKQDKTFTLSPGILAFVAAYRHQIGARSESEALAHLIRTHPLFSGSDE